LISSIINILQKFEIINSKRLTKTAIKNHNFNQLITGITLQEKPMEEEYTGLKSHCNYSDFIELGGGE